MAWTVPFSDARARLRELLDEVESRHQHVVITRSGKPAAVLLATEEYEALQETLEVLADEAAMRDLAGSAADVEAGRVTSWQEVKGRRRRGATRPHPCGRSRIVQ